MNMLGLNFRRECVLLWRQSKSVVNACLFFLMIMVFFPLGFEADTQLLQAILPGLIWIGILFVFYLSSEQLFQTEYDAEVLTQWVISGDDLSFKVRIKMLVFWIFYGLPMMSLCSIIGLLFSLSISQTLSMMLVLICGSPALFCLCAFAQVFNLSQQHRGVFTALIVLPLMLPILIFGGGALSHGLNGQPIDGPLVLLLALSLFAFWVMPYLIALMIRLNVADGGAKQ